MFQDGKNTVNAWLKNPIQRKLKDIEIPQPAALCDPPVDPIQRPRENEGNGLFG